MFKIESYLSPFLLNWLNSYVKLKNEDFKLSLWEGDAVFYKLDLRLDVIQDLLRLPLNIRSGRIQELRIHIPWTKLGSEPVCLTINTIEFVLSLPSSDEKSSSSQKTGEAETTEFENNAVLIEPREPQLKTQSDQKQPSYLEAIVFKILNNMQIVVNNLIVKYVEGDMIVSINVKSAETWSTDVDWNKAFVDALPPDYGLRKIANLHDATICLDRCTPSGKIESYNEPFMYRCSLQCKMLFEYASPYARVPSSSMIAFFFGEPEFSLADTQLPLLLRLIRTGLSVIYDNGETQKACSMKRRLSSASVPVIDESGIPRYSPNNQSQGWGNWAMSYLPGVVSWTTGFQAPILLPLPEGEESHPPKPSFTFVGIYAESLTMSLKLSKKHVDPLGSSSRIQFHPCLTVVASGVRNEMMWRGDTFFACSVIVSSILGKTSGFCTCHVRDDGEQFIACGIPNNKRPLNLFDQVLLTLEGVPKNVDEHLEKYSEEAISELSPAFMLDFITDSDKSREKPGAPFEELRRFQRAIFRWFMFNPTLWLTGGLFHRMTKFLGHAQKSEFDLFSSIRSGGDQVGATSISIPTLFDDSDATPSLDFNVCGRSDKVDIRNFTVFIALNNHPSALPGKHSGIFAQRLPQIGSPLRLCAGRTFMAKTEPLYPKEIGLALKAYPGPLSEETLAPCCSHSVIELSNISLDLPSETGATFAIACGLSFSVSAKSFSNFDTAILSSVSFPENTISFVIPEVSMTFNYPCLLYASLLASSYSSFNGCLLSTGATNTSAAPSSHETQGIQILSTALLGMIYAHTKESFVLNISNSSIQRADFSHLHSSRIVSCLSVVLSSISLQCVTSAGGFSPLISFKLPDVPSAAIYVQWEKSAVHYVLASISPFGINFSNHLNEILQSVDLRKYFHSVKDDGINDSMSAVGPMGKSDAEPGPHRQSAFRLLADLLASDTVSTNKPEIKTGPSNLISFCNSLEKAVINVHLSSLQINLLDQFFFSIPHTSFSTPTGFKRSFTQQLFNLDKPLDVAPEETMLWTIRMEKMALQFASQQMLDPPLTIWATLSAIQSTENVPSLPRAESSPAALAKAQLQLSLHINVDAVSLCLRRSILTHLMSLKSTVSQTASLVSSQLTLFSNPDVISKRDLEQEVDITPASFQFWIQITIPRASLYFYLDDEAAAERRIILILETGTFSIDNHPLYQKIRIKFQTIHGETERKTVLGNGDRITWTRDNTFFFVSNSQLFDFNLYQLPYQLTEMAQDDLGPAVGDDFVISITSARVRDVFLRIHENVTRGAVVARSTSGEPFSPSIIGAGASFNAEDQQHYSGITEICISIPNIDLVLGHDAIRSLPNATKSSSRKTVQTSSPVIYLNSGVVRAFLNLHCPLAQSNPYDFLLFCTRLAVTSDVEFNRSRRQTICAENSFNLNPARSSAGLCHQNSDAEQCDSHIQISLQQLSVHAGNWAFAASSSGRLSPHSMNNPALQWNMRMDGQASTTDQPIFLSVLANPIDMNISLTGASAEIIFKHSVELQVLLNILPGLARWAQAFSAFSGNSDVADAKCFEVSVLCPSLVASILTVTSSALMQHLKVAVTRPQIVQQCSSKEAKLKASCHHLEITCGSGSFKFLEVLENSDNLFSPAVTLSNSMSDVEIKFQESIQCNVNSDVIAEMFKLFEEIRTVSSDIRSIMEEKSTLEDTRSLCSRVSVFTERLTTCYRMGTQTATISGSSLHLSTSIFNAASHSSRFRMIFKVEKLLSFLSNNNLHFDHCILQPMDLDVVLDQHEFCVKAHSDSQRFKQSAYLCNASPVSISLTEECFVIANDLMRSVEASMNDKSSACPEVTALSPAKSSDIFFASHDDLRNEAVRYTFVAQSLVSACDSGAIPVTTPDPEQIYIAADGLFWCYNEPRTLTKLQLSPLPFTVQGGQDVICVLQRFDDLHSRFEPIISFRVPTEKTFSVQIEQNAPPSLAFRILLKQPVAPPIKNELNATTSESSESVPPPATLAACCCVDSNFSSKLTPSLTAIGSLSKFTINLSQSLPTVTKVTSRNLPFPTESPRIRYPPQRLVVAKLNEVCVQAISVPEKGLSCDVRFSAKLSCLNPRNSLYCDIVDAAARLNFVINNSTLALNVDVHRLNVVIDDCMLRIIHSSFNHLIRILLSFNLNEACREFSPQIPTTFLYNLTGENLNVCDLDSTMPAPDIKVLVQHSVPFPLSSIYLTSREWHSPLSLAEWFDSTDQKVVRVMPNDSHAIVISKHTYKIEGENPVTILSVSSSLIVANCLNASFVIKLSESNSIEASPMRVCSAHSDFKLREDNFTFEIKTSDGMWSSSSPVNLNLKSGTFAFVSMKTFVAEEGNSSGAKHHNSFTLVVSLVVEKIEAFYHVLLLILPPYVLENKFPSEMKVSLTNANRGRVVCPLEPSNFPYPFCDIDQEDMVHMSQTLDLARPDDDLTEPVTLSLNSLANRTDFSPSKQRQESINGIESCIHIVSKWLKSAAEKSETNSCSTFIAADAAIRVVPFRLFPFAPTISMRCLPGVEIVNDTAVPLVMLSPDGSALSLDAKSTICSSASLTGIKFGYYDANSLWQSKPFDIAIEIDNEDIFVMNEESVDFEEDYRENYSADRISLPANRSCRFGIVVSSLNVECLLVLTSEISKVPSNGHGMARITISSFLSVANRSSLVSSIEFSRYFEKNSNTPANECAFHSIANNDKLFDVPFVGLTKENGSKYTDSIFLSFNSSNDACRISFGSVPFRYVTTVAADVTFAALSITIISRENGSSHKSKRLVIAISDNPFHDVTLRNTCDFDIYVREKPITLDETGFTTEDNSISSSFSRIPSGCVLEHTFPSSDNHSVQFGVIIPTTENIVWSETVSLPTLIHPSSSLIVANSVNIVSFGNKSVCDLQLHVDLYCDTIPHVIIKNLIKTYVSKQDNKNIVVKPATRTFSIGSDDGILSRRSSSFSLRSHSPAGSTMPTMAHHRTLSFTCQLENVQAVMNGVGDGNPRFVATIDGLSFGVSHFGIRSNDRREPSGGTFQAAAKRIQIDNFMDASRKPTIKTAFPTILLSSNPDDSTYCIRIHGNLLSRLNETTVTSLTLTPGSFTAFVEDVTMKDFVETIVQISSIFESEARDEQTFCVSSNPLPLRLFVIESCHLDLTIRASLYIYIAANHTPLSLGAFRIEATAVTWQQLIHRMTTFYVRGAIFRAGLLVGSLNIIGRPLSLVRTTTSAVRDICFSPFSGRGILSTASSAARSVFADAVLSVADFAESLGRNVGQFSDQSQFPSQQPSTVLDGLRQGFTAFGLSIVGAIGGLAGRPIEEIMGALEAPAHEIRSFEQQTALRPRSSLSAIARVSAAATRGVGLGLVGLVTQPMAGLSELVAVTGHGLLNTVGQPSLPSAKHVNSFFTRSERLDSRNIWYRVEDALAALQFAGGHVISLLMTDSANICIVLCRQTISLYDLSERILQQSLFISDIDIVCCKENSKSILKVYRRSNPHHEDDEFGEHLNEFEINKWRVEAFLASSEPRPIAQTPGSHRLYQNALTQPNMRRSKKSSSNAPSATLIHSFNIRDSHKSEHVVRFMAIFHYFRDVRVSLGIGDKS